MLSGITLSLLIVIINILSICILKILFDVFALDLCVDIFDQKRIALLHFIMN